MARDTRRLSQGRRNNTRMPSSWTRAGLVLAGVSGAAAFAPMGGAARGFVTGRSGASSSSSSVAMAGLPNGFSLRLPDIFGTQKQKMSAGAGMYPIVGEESIMSPKEHGTSKKPVQKDLKWNCDFETADRICNFNRHYAEYAGYWRTTEFLKEADRTNPITFYDSVTGKPLFIAPKGRTFDEFVAESDAHGWPSFRDEEVVWDNVRCLRDGESVSVDGTHLGHNLPDRKGNRYCINLVSVAGRPEK